MTVLISSSSENIVGNRTIEKHFFFSDEKSVQFKCAFTATSHSCSFFVSSWALVAILVSLEQKVNWPQLSCLCELACNKKASKRVISLVTWVTHCGFAIATIKNWWKQTSRVKGQLRCLGHLNKTDQSDYTRTTTMNSSHLDQSFKIQLTCRTDGLMRQTGPEVRIHERGARPQARTASRKTFRGFFFRDARFAFVVAIHIHVKHFACFPAKALSWRLRFHQKQTSSDLNLFSCA